MRTQLYEPAQHNELLWGIREKEKNVYQVPADMYVHLIPWWHIYIPKIARYMLAIKQARCFQLRKLDFQTRSAGVVQHKDKEFVCDIWRYVSLHVSNRKWHKMMHQNKISPRSHWGIRSLVYKAVRGNYWKSRQRNACFQEKVGVVGEIFILTCFFRTFKQEMCIFLLVYIVEMYIATCSHRKQE